MSPTSQHRHRQLQDSPPSGKTSPANSNEDLLHTPTTPRSTSTSYVLSNSLVRLVSRKTRAARLKRLLLASSFLIGLIVCVTSLVCIILLPQFVSNQVAKKLVLRNNSMLLERWSKPNVPMLFKVWIFNVKNSQEIISNRSVKPQLEEIGPFVFNLKRQKDVISFAADNLYYTERKIYHFNEQLSCCSFNTTVTIPNIPLVAVVDRALGYQLPLLGRFIPRLINRAIQSLREPLFVKKQVREILFDGYEVELLKMVSRVGSLVGLPQTNQKFAILKGRNDSWRPEQDGVWAINTGAKDRKMFGRVSSWNSYRQLPFWASPACNAINGSDGTLFPPPISNKEPLYIFNQELCRTVNLVYQAPSDVHTIQSYRFVLNPLNFAHTMTGSPKASSTTSRPLSQAASARRSSPQSVRKERQQQERLIREAQTESAFQKSRSQQNPNTCFCDRKSTNLNGNNVCEFDGLIDLSKCTKQAQVIFGSMPHFFQSDPRLAQQVDGMKPSESKHTTYLDIEPNTGLVLGGKRRVQLNLMLKRNTEVEGFENIRDSLVPLLWFEESAQIPQETAHKFKALYTDRIRFVKIVLVSLFLIALGLLAIDAKIILSQYDGFWLISQDRSNVAAVVDQKTGKRRANYANDSSTTLDSSLGIPPSGKLANGGGGDSFVISKAPFDASVVEGGTEINQANATSQQQQTNNGIEHKQQQLNLPLLMETNRQQQLDDDADTTTNITVQGPRYLKHASSQ